MSDNDVYERRRGPEPGILPTYQCVRAPGNGIAALTTTRWTFCPWCGEKLEKHPVDPGRR